MDLYLSEIMARYFVQSQPNRLLRMLFWQQSHESLQRIALGQGYAFSSRTIFIAEVINAATSVMLLGTMSVVVASDATRE